MSKDEGWTRCNGSSAGKGDAVRFGNEDKRRAEHDRIFGKKKINGVYVPPEVPKTMGAVGGFVETQEMY